MMGKTGTSLGTRIFLITALLIALAVGTAVLSTFLLSGRIARGAVDKALERAAVAQRSLQRQNDAQLEQMLAALTDPALVAYVDQGIADADRASLVDKLQELQTEIGFDFALVLDQSGRLITGVPRGGGNAEVAGRPLVAKALSSKAPEVGVWTQEGKLYNAAVAPLATGLGVSGYLVAGFQVDEIAARDLATASGTEVAYVLAEPEGRRIVASTLEARRAEDLLRALGGGSGQEAMQSGPAGSRLDFELGGEPWAGRVIPLLDANKKPVGATVALASLEQQLQPFRSIQWVLLITGGIAIASALALSYALSRRTLAPVRRLVASANAARQGDYNQRVAVEGGDEVGQLAVAYNQLLSDLREKREMETYLGDLARTLPEPARSAPVAEAPHLAPVTLLAAELRRYARKEASNDPEQTLRRLAKDVRRAETAVSSRRGKLYAPLGHRLIATFEGEGKAARALAAAAELAAALGAPEDAFDEPAEPLVALAGGVISTGTVTQGDFTAQALVGMPVQKLEALLREAAPGDIVLAREVYDDLGKLLTEAGITVSAQRGVLSPMPAFAVKAQDAARLTGVDVTAVSAPTAMTQRSAAVAELSPGKMLGTRFEILAQLGAGGMGIVFKARDRDLGDLVALKVLRRQALEDPVQLERLKDELRLARKITHPNVLRTHDFGELDGVHFISMEYVRGVTLRFMLDQAERLPFSAGLRVAKQLAAGLGAAHAQGVIHRDIKPDNVILDQAGNAKLMDFGIARPVERLTPGHTQAGWIVGTPQFMAPEQLEGREVDARADIYACGVVLYEIFTGHLPFTADSPMQVVMQHLSAAPPPPRSYWPEMPPLLENIILTCLAKKPEGRFAKVAALAAELDKLSA